MRILGKRQIGQLQPGEFVITMLISEIACMPLQETSMPLIYGIVPILILAMFEIISSLAAMKFIRLRSVLQGHSIIVIKNGRLEREQLRRLRYTLDDLMEALRQKDVFDISDVQYAIVETDGSLSVLLKPEKRPASVSDVNAEPETTGLPRVLISDGRIIDAQIKKSVKTKKDVEKILRKNKISSKDVLLLTADDNGNINIIKKD